MRLLPNTIKSVANVLTGLLRLLRQISKLVVYLLPALKLHLRKVCTLASNVRSSLRPLGC